MIPDTQQHVYDRRNIPSITDPVIRVHLVSLVRLDGHQHTEREQDKKKGSGDKVIETTVGRILCIVWKDAIKVSQRDSRVCDDLLSAPLPSIRG
jgi:hypothetical protein